MTVEKKTAAQFATDLRTAILSRDNSQDVGYGPIDDIVVSPVALVLEDQNERLRQVSLLLSLVNSTAFSDSDLEDFVFNEGLKRDDGSQATGTATFYTYTKPLTNLVVQRGFPLSSTPDEATNQSLTFITSETQTLVASSASSYFNTTTQRYELVVAIAALTQGSSGRVGPNRVRRALRPLVGFDGVTNTEALSQGGANSETNARLIDRYLISIIGRQLNTPTGIKKYILDNFSAVEDVLAVYGDDALIERSSDVAGAVDVFVVGTDSQTRTDASLVFLGIGQLLQLTHAPVLGITTVTNVTTPATYTEDVDFEFVQDSTGNSRSERAVDGIRFIAAGPAVGDVISVAYTSNQLIRDLQENMDTEEVTNFGRDLLVREGVQVDIILAATLTTVSGFNPSTVAALVSSALLSYVNALEFGDAVEASDLQGVVRAISSVDNFVITALHKSTEAAQVHDISIERDEYAKLDTGALTLA